MKKIKYSFFCRLDTKIKIKLGLDTKADIQDKIIKEYNKFLELKNQIVNYAKEKIELKSDLEVKYKWIDIDNNQLENKYNSFNFVTNYEEYEDIIKIAEKIETLKVQLKYSEDWENAHRNKKIIERKIK